MMKIKIISSRLKKLNESYDSKNMSREELRADGKARLKIYDEILEKDPNDEEALYQKACTLFICFVGDTDYAARDMLQKLVDLGSKNVDVYFWLAECLLRHIGDFYAAEKIAKQGLALDQNRADLHSLLVWILWEFDKDEEVIFHLKKALELEPTWIGNRTSLIEGYIKKKDYVQAKIEIEKAKNCPMPKFSQFRGPIEEHYVGLINWETEKEVKESLDRFEKEIRKYE